MRIYLLIGALLTLVIGGCVKSSIRKPELYTKITLERKEGKIYISNEFGKWEDENIVGKVLSGTKPTPERLNPKEMDIIYYNYIKDNKKIEVVWDGDIGKSIVGRMVR